MAVQTVRRPQPARTITALLGQAREGVHIDALAQAVYGSLSRRSVQRVMRAVSRLRQAGVRIRYDRRQRVYQLVG